MFDPINPMVDYPKMEEKILELWKENRIFSKLQIKNSQGPKWSFIDGPITANNAMGVHHAWGRTYKDIFQRYKAMRGYQQRYQNGFDCQGLWVEVEVEKELGLNSKRDIREYGLEKFAEACRARVNRFADRIVQQSIRLGQWMQWYDEEGQPASYFTMADLNIEHIWHFLKKCHDKDWLYRGHRVMPWCWRCGTSLSQHELIDSYQERVDPSVYFKCPIHEKPGESFLVWTTTPWTLTSNTGVALHPDFDYARVSVENDIFYVASSRLAEVFPAGVEVLGTVKGADLIGLSYSGPYDEIPAQAKVRRRSVPWDMISADEGTGIVHTAPGCGAEDFELSKIVDLDVLAPLDEDGYFLPEFGFLSGKHVTESPELVKQDLEHKKVLVKWETYQHRYPVCWRCQTPLVYLLADEWFIACQEIREPMKQEARKVRWDPEYAGKFMDNWLDNMGDWCISRRRFWGLPLPFYLCSCGKMTVVGSRQELRNLAIVPQVVDELPELHRPWIDQIQIRCPGCGESASRITDVGDCWLDAGIVPYSTLHYLDEHLAGSDDDSSRRRESPCEDSGHASRITHHSTWSQWFPAQWISEMREQVRLWFYSMLFMSVTLEGRAPYLAVSTYEEMRDENGEAFSKTKGNAIWFDEAADRMGADVMRWVYAGSPLNQFMRFGYGPADEVKRRMLTLWNVVSFFVTYANLDKPDLTSSVKGSDLADLDRWLIACQNKLLQQVTEAYDCFDSATVTRLVEGFVEELSNWYVRRCRRRFWKGEEDSDKQAAYQTLYQALIVVTRVIAPILPFTAEEIYQNLVRGVDNEAPESVHLTVFPVVCEQTLDQALIDEMALVQRIVSLGRSARTESKIKVRQPLARMLIKTAHEPEQDILARFRDVLMEELNVKAVDFVVDTSQFVSHSVKPDFAKLGPKYGKLMPAIKTVLEGADHEDMAARRQAGQQIEILVNGQPISLEPEDVEIETKPAQNLAVVEESGYVVALDTQLTTELVQEGLIRDLIRQIQNLRKQAGFRVEDKITTWIQAEPALNAAIERFAYYVQQETLTIAIHKSTPPEEAYSSSVKIGEGMTLIAVKRI